LPFHITPTPFACPDTPAPFQSACRCPCRFPQCSFSSFAIYAIFFRRHYHDILLSLLFFFIPYFVCLTLLSHLLPSVFLFLSTLSLHRAISPWSVCLSSFAQSSVFSTIQCAYSFTFASASFGSSYIFSVPLSLFSLFQVHDSLVFIYFHILHIIYSTVHTFFSLASLHRYHSPSLHYFLFLRHCFRFSVITLFSFFSSFFHCLTYYYTFLAILHHHIIFPAQLQLFRLSSLSLPFSRQPLALLIIFLPVQEIMGVFSHCFTHILTACLSFSTGLHIFYHSISQRSLFSCLLLSPAILLVIFLFHISASPHIFSSISSFSLLPTKGFRDQSLSSSHSPHFIESCLLQSSRDPYSAYRATQKLGYTLDASLEFSMFSSLSSYHPVLFLFIHGHFLSGCHCFLHYTFSFIFTFLFIHNIHSPPSLLLFLVSSVRGLLSVSPLPHCSCPSSSTGPPPPTVSALYLQSSHKVSSGTQSLPSVFSQCRLSCQTDPSYYHFINSPSSASLYCW